MDISFAHFLNVGASQAFILSFLLPLHYTLSFLNFSPVWCVLFCAAFCHLDTLLSFRLLYLSVLQNLSPLPMFPILVNTSGLFKGEPSMLWPTLSHSPHPVLTCHQSPVLPILLCSTVFLLIATADPIICTTITPDP